MTATFRKPSNHAEFTELPPMYLTSRQISTAALLAALLCAVSLIAIPLPGGVPLTLQVLVVVLIALVESPLMAGFSVGVYLLLGAVGFPVFAGMSGGLSALLGPTGGFLVGFLVAAVAGSAARRLLAPRAGTLAADIVAAGVALLAIYALGLPWLMFVTKLALPVAFGVAVVPFIVPDAIKAAVAIGIAAALRRAGFGDGGPAVRP
jgi:biotin transport system substrate-specific component